MITVFIGALAALAVNRSDYASVIEFECNLSEYARHLTRVMESHFGVPVLCLFTAPPSYDPHPYRWAVGRSYGGMQFDMAHDFEPPSYLAWLANEPGWIVCKCATEPGLTPSRRVINLIELAEAKTNA